jgi:tRNA nucleotidyltransferase (CCA-adding enzyme)
MRGGATTNEDNNNGRGGGGIKEQGQKRRVQQWHPKIGVIGANPSQSKHLKTATMKIHGIDVNFVNLQANEVYGANSCIPTFGSVQGSCGLAFGMPLKGALCRNFTINW